MCIRDSVSCVEREDLSPNREGRHVHSQPGPDVAGLVLGKGAEKGSSSGWSSSEQQEARQQTSRTRANYSAPDAHVSFWCTPCTGGANRPLPGRVFNDHPYFSSVLAPSGNVTSNLSCTTSGGTKEVLVMYSRPWSVRPLPSFNSKFVVTSARWDDDLQFALMVSIETFTIGAVCWIFWIPCCQRAIVGSHQGISCTCIYLSLIHI